ncbi:hypothetical protein [Solirubrobacter soli]|uniref:hypothetical protein n=1 Tax=Solirubrobacter soli TaxID=363832 RepID=UPI0003F58169|nr:hypothetical protein [Solirubrobacter soli]
MTERSTTLTIAGVSAIGLIHLLDSVGTYHETRWLFWAYVLLMGATIVVAAALLHHPDRRAFTGAALVAAAPLFGYILSRTTGLPGADDDIGNWTDPLGLASLWVEGAVLLTAGYALAPRTVARPLRVEPLET